MTRIKDGWSGSQSNPCVVTAEQPKTTGVVGTPYGDLRFLNVKGNMTQMAAESARRLKDEIHLGVIPYFSGYLKKILKQSPVSAVSSPLNFALFGTVAETLRDNLPREFQLAMEEFAHVAGIDREQMYRAYLMPETFLYMLGTYHRILGSPRALGLGAPPMFGCTCLLYTSPSPRDLSTSRMPSSA